MTIGRERGMLASMNSPILSSSQFPWLTLARVFQVLVICLTIGLFIVSIPINYEHRSIVCVAEPCPPDQLKSASVHALNRIGMTAASFASMSIGFDILVAAIFVSFGVATFTGALPN